MKKSFIALILSALIILTSGCSTAPTKSETTTADSNAAVQATQEAEQAESPTLQQTSVPDETTAQSNQPETTAPDTDETTAPQTLTRTEDIVAYFNKSANRIKTEAVKVVKNYEKRVVNEDDLQVPAALESVVPGMISSLMKDDTEPIVYATREEIVQNFLVPEQSYVSLLDPAYVEVATCTDKGDRYEIYLRLKNHVNPTSGVGVGAVCDVIEAGEVAEKAPFIEKFSTEYRNCEIKATINKATGRVTHINYIAPLILRITVNMFGTHDAAAGLSFEKDYTVTY